MIELQVRTGKYDDQHQQHDRTRRREGNMELLRNGAEVLTLEAVDKNAGGCQQQLADPEDGRPLKGQMHIVEVLDNVIRHTDRFEKEFHRIAIVCRNLGAVQSWNGAILRICQSFSTASLR